MKVTVVDHGLKYLFGKETKSQCPECNYIAHISADTWLSIKILKKKSGRVFAAQYECPRCLCVFNYEED